MTRTDGPLARDRIDTPVGTLTVVVSDRGVRAVLWPDDRPGRVRLPATVDEPGHPVLRAAFDALRNYFVDPTSRSTVPLDVRGTPFQHAVWDELGRIEPGTTISYATLAARLGRPGSARAVGAAVGRNPVSILVPCHRVVGADGALTGFAGGLAAKQWLLAFEQVTPPRACVSVSM
jgi:methylated-DNA-[protein]-cysteine S-methyltransferase